MSSARTGSQVACRPIRKAAALFERAPSSALLSTHIDLSYFTDRQIYQYLDGLEPARTRQIVDRYGIHFVLAPLGAAKLYEQTFDAEPLFEGEHYVLLQLKP